MLTKNLLNLIKCNDMGKIFLIRHGQTDWNKSEQFRGRADIKLNQTGIEQAKALSQRLSDSDLAAVYSSPLQRALKTAAIIAQAHGLSAQAEPGFIDVDYGEWQGLTLQEIGNQFPVLYQQWLTDPSLVTFPRGESIQAVSDRALTALRNLATQHPGENIVIVAHQAVNKIILFELFKIKPLIWEIPQDVAAVNVLEHNGKDFKLNVLNDITHLQRS